VALDEYQDGTLPSAQTLKRCIRSGTLAGRFVPVLCGSAFRNRGIRLLLDAVVDFLPSPTERPAVKGHAVPTGEPVERMAGDGEPFTGYVFRGMDDPAVGELTFLRVFSGRLAKGGTVLNSSNDNRAQVDRILRMHATFREDLEEASAGDIVALPGFSGAAGGDTLCDPLHPVVLEHSVLPSPVNEFAVRAKLA
jgi:elongation factor G